MQNAMKAQMKARELEERTQQLAATARAEQQYEATVAAALATARPSNVSHQLQGSTIWHTAVVVDFLRIIHHCIAGVAITLLASVQHGVAQQPYLETAHLCH